MPSQAKPTPRRPHGLAAARADMTRLALRGGAPVRDRVWPDLFHHAALLGGSDDVADIVAALDKVRRYHSEL